MPLIDPQPNPGSQLPRSTMPRRFKRRFRGVFAGIGAIGISLTCSALEPATPLAEFGRQSWVMENGLPQNSVHAVAQTRDGFVWLGTEAGLVRFDGVGFAVFDRNSKPAFPSGDIRCLLAGKDGSLWVGTAEGLARLKDGAVTTFTTANGLAANRIREIAETSDGTLWVETEQGLARFESNNFVPAGQGQLAGTVNAIAADNAGGLWADTQEGLSQWFQGRWHGPNFAKQLAGVDAKILRESDAGSWLVATNSEVRFLKRSGEETVFKIGRELPGSRVQTVFADRQRCLWVGTNGGLVRVIDGQVQKLPATDPLAGTSILSLLEDREGNLWVGTETDGLQVLRDARFHNIGAREGLSSDATSTVVEDSAGKIWVGTDGGSLNVVRRTAGVPGETSTYAVRDVLLSDVILSLAAAKNGDLWVGTPDGLNRIRGSAVDSFTSADGLPDDFIRSLLVDADGSVWLGTRRGLAHWTFAGRGTNSMRLVGKKETYTQANGLGSDLVGAMARDSDGSLWIATFAGLSRLKDGKIANYTTADGLSSNVVTALLSGSNGTLLVGTQDRGWNLWDGAKFSAVTDDVPRRTSVHAILDDGLNHLWFATANGIARCDWTRRADCTHWMEFGPADGLRSRETAINSHPSAWRSRDGHLWFATPRGLVEVDPAHFPVNSLPPPIAVERFAVDDVDALQAGNPLVKIPAGHNHFQFDYAGLSFVAPQKVRYRYMLEGFDHDWTEAGARRVAYYTNIPPGTYTFRVQAANNDGVWNLRGATLEFELQPHFYQTIWFYIFLALAMAGLVAFLLRRRLLVAEREFGAVLGERNRIAREIHDTLAQGYVGISVQLEVLAELLRHRKVDEAAKQLDTTRGYVREGLAEARQSIWALRSQDSGETTLPVNLRRITEQAQGHGLDSNFSVHGAYRPLSSGAEREIVRVAQEAIHNVKKHAAAKHLFVQLNYGPAEIGLEVRDDGLGFEADGASHAPPGHFGLMGMHERAAAIGGTLEVNSGPGAGTTVRLHAPAPREAE
ncbi:MAG TPA: two-component regulator propeller domain-containing protein [Terracidiphilus sp.]|nr:two-component regulator propeller domain-containing protein [Terracidiphilus sp.]